MCGSRTLRSRVLAEDATCQSREDLGSHLGRPHSLVEYWTERRSRPGEQRRNLSRRLTGDFVCAYGCRPTDANPSVRVKNGEADCVNGYSGIFRGKPLGADGVACPRKTGRLSADGLMRWRSPIVDRSYAAMSLVSARPSRC
jgi:hypothetical protein